MEWHKPPALAAGDTVAVVALSSGLAAELPHRYAAGKRQLKETFGVRVIDAPHALCDSAWLQAHPEARADDLHWALTDDSVAGIVSAIGGDDSIRTVPLLDLDLIGRHPKVFLGFSDSTVQHLANLAAGVVTFYGPSVLADLAENRGIHPYTEHAVRAAVFTARPFALEPAPEWSEDMLDWADPALQQRRRRYWPHPGWTWMQGDQVVEGPLLGGCMDVLEMAKGTAVWPRADAWDGAVLALEISEEAPSPDQVTHWLRNYAATGVLDRIGAMLFSRPLWYSQRDTFRLYDAVHRVLVESGRDDVPLVVGLDHGHGSPMGVLPLGCRVRVDPVRRTIEVTEPAVA
jgi:muramoyltetrapeptide carboxypeptidase LdcA involved in peptidoglycan recycling